MYLSRLVVENLRILEGVDVFPGSGLNVIRGGNGAGKTSLLEAIHILGTGRSFRGRRLEVLVRRGAGSLRVFGEVRRDNGSRVGIGVERGKGGMRVRVGGKAVASSSGLAQELSLALVTPESHRLLTGGPKERRRILDWGLFHVEQGYLELLQRYTRALRQRNAALRGWGSKRRLFAWDRELILAGEEISRHRERYVAGLESAVREVMAALLGQPVSLSFKRGWGRDESLTEALSRTLARDRGEGRTTVGPHRADLEFRLGGIPAEEALSRGQAKLFVSGVELAQVTSLAQQSGRTPVVLVDDLPSELDEENRGRFLELLARRGAQVFVTLVDEGLLGGAGWHSHRLFHVEQGRVHEVV